MTPDDFILSLSFHRLLIGISRKKYRMEFLENGTYLLIPENLHLNPVHKSVVFHASMI